MTTTEISLNVEPAERTNDAVQVEQTISTSNSLSLVLIVCSTCTANNQHKRE